MNLTFRSTTALALALALAGPAFADMDAAQAVPRRRDRRHVGPVPRGAGSRDAVVHRRRPAVPGHGHQGGVRDDHHPRVRKPGAGPRLHRDHRHQRHPRPDRRRRRGREAADPDAVGREHLRRLRQRLRPDRHPLALPAGAQPDRLDGRRRRRRDLAHAGPRRLHRHCSSPPAPDGKLYQLPDQQFANLYWFRYDWFNDEKNKADFKEKYGYDLGVPVNWSAYEDIAEFFTGRDMRTWASTARSTATWTTARRTRRLGWRYTDAWMSMAGMGDKGEPNGLPVDEWGIRVNENSPARRRLRRPAAARPTRPRRSMPSTKAIEWLDEVLAAAAAGMTFSEAGPVPAQGNIAQQMFWYTAFTADMVGRGADAGDERGRHAQVAHGPLPARRLLGRGHEGRLPGRGLLDADEVDPGRPRQGRLALRAVRHLEDGGREEIGRGPDLHPRSRPSTRTTSPSGRPSWAAWSSSTARPARTHGRPPAPTCPTTRSWRSCGGRTSATPCPARRPRKEALDSLCERAGAGDRAARARRRPGRPRSEAERAAGPGVMAEPAGRAEGQAGERGAGARDDRLRRADQVLAGVTPARSGPAAPTTPPPATARGARRQ